MLTSHQFCVIFLISVSQANETNLCWFPAQFGNWLSTELVVLNPDGQAKSYFIMSPGWRWTAARLPGSTETTWTLSLESYLTDRPSRAVISTSWHFRITIWICWYAHTWQQINRDLAFKLLSQMYLSLLWCMPFRIRPTTHCVSFSSSVGWGCKSRFVKILLISDTSYMSIALPVYFISLSFSTPIFSTVVALCLQNEKELLWKRTAITWKTAVLYQSIDPLQMALYSAISVQKYQSINFYRTWLSQNFIQFSNICNFLVIQCHDNVADSNMSSRCSTWLYIRNLKISSLFKWKTTCNSVIWLSRQIRVFFVAVDISLSFWHTVLQYNMKDWLAT